MPIRNLQAFDVLPKPGGSLRNAAYWLIVEDVRPNDRTEWQRIRNISIHATRPEAVKRLEEMRDAETKRVLWWSTHPTIGLSCYGIESTHHRIKFELFQMFKPEEWPYRKHMAWEKVADVFDETPWECDHCGAEVPKGDTDCSQCGQQESNLFWDQAGGYPEESF